MRQAGAFVPLIVAGLMIVLGSVVAGYVLEHGNMFVLLQPAELVIIGGGAAGIILISNPRRSLRAIASAFGSLRKRKPYTQETYLGVLKLLYVLFQYGRRSGMAALESHVEEPARSEIFRAHRPVLADRPALDFICDSFRISIAAGVDGHDLERLMAHDMEVQRSGRQQPVRMLTIVADSLPGLGIVAAVLGVVVTMQALGGPASEIGQKVAAALVGTFLGILLCYGVIGPLATHLDCMNQARSEYFQAIRAAIAASFNGASPLVAAEAGRRSIPLDLRPSFDAMEKQLRKLRIPAKRDQTEPAAKEA